MNDKKMLSEITFEDILKQELSYINSLEYDEYEYDIDIDETIFQVNREGETEFLHEIISSLIELSLQEFLDQYIEKINRISEYLDEKIYEDEKEDEWSYEDYKLQSYVNQCREIISIFDEELEYDEECLTKNKVQQEDFSVDIKKKLCDIVLEDILDEKLAYQFKRIKVDEDDDNYSQGMIKAFTEIKKDTDKLNILEFKNKYVKAAIDAENVRHYDSSISFLEAEKLEGYSDGICVILGLVEKELTFKVNEVSKQYETNEMNKQLQKDKKVWEITFEEIIQSRLNNEFNNAKETNPDFKEGKKRALKEMSVDSNRLDIKEFANKYLQIVADSKHKTCNDSLSNKTQSKFLDGYCQAIKEILEIINGVYGYQFK